MSTLTNLAIQGVRSYSPDQPQSIEFFQPLTIILGKNGSGKTTVIEAIKYICTGSHPPSSNNGKSFVHDPKIRGTSEVRATVVANFQSAEGEVFSVEKSCGVAQGKTDAKYKTHESRLVAAGLQRTMRKDELETELPQMLGVSQAILESVTFCHQEESTWPMSDGKALKERFDAIFASTQYAKALDEVLKQGKEMRVRLKDAETELKLAENNRRLGHHRFAALQESDKQIATRRVELVELERISEKATQAADAVRAHQAQVQALREQHQRLQGAAELHQRNIHETRKVLETEIVTLESQAEPTMHGQRQQDNISLLQLDTSALQQHIEQLQASLHELEVNANTEKQSESEALEDFEQAKLKLNAAEQNLAVEKKAKELYENDARDLKEMVEHLSERHGIMTSSGPAQQFNPCDPIQRIQMRENMSQLLSKCQVAESEQSAKVRANEVNRREAQTEIVTKAAETLARRDIASKALGEHAAKKSQAEALANELLSTLYDREVHIPSENLLSELKTLSERSFTDFEDATVLDIKARLDQCRESREGAEISITNLANRQQTLAQVRKILRERANEMEGLSDFVRGSTGRLRTALTGNAEVVDLLTGLSSDLHEILPSVSIQDAISELVKLNLPLIQEVSPTQSTTTHNNNHSMSKSAEYLQDFNLWTSLIEAQWFEQYNSAMPLVHTTIESTRTAFMKARDSALSNAMQFENRMAQLDTELGDVTSRIQMVRSNQAEKEQEHIQLHAALKDTCGKLSSEVSLLPSDFENMQELEDKLQHVRDRLSVALTAARRTSAQREGILSLYEEFSTKAKSDRSCPLCTRPFGEQDDDDYARFVQALDSYAKGQAEFGRMIAELGQSSDVNVDELEQRLTQVQSCLQHINSASSLELECKQLAQSHGELSKHHEALVRESAQLRTTTRTATAAAKKLTEIEPRISLLTSRVTNLVQLSTNLLPESQRFKAISDSVARVAARSTLASLESPDNLSPSEQSSWLDARTFVEVTQACEEVEHELHVSADAWSDARSQYTQLERAMKMLTDELNERLSAQNERKDAWVNLCKLYSETFPELQAECEEALKVLQNANQEAETAIAEREEILSKLTAERLEDEAKLTHLRELVASVQRDLERFTEYSSRLLTREKGIAGVWEKVTAALVAARSQLSLTENAYSLASSRRKLADEALRRAMIRLALAQRVEAVLQEEALLAKTQTQQASIHAQLRSMGAGETDTDYETAAQKAREDVAHASGALQQLIQQADADRRDLERNFADAELRYRHAAVKCGALSLMVNDLQIYSKALDSALMRFHSMKLQDVNEILRDSWRETYQGSDIDEIYIKSEAEGGNGTVSDENNLLTMGSEIKSTRRTYNYRVVMRKGDREIDMKGRCSMGQKVLASLLIRLALAEVFSVRCGMLALDEPTTNLDKANSRAFAEALAAIIEHRRRSSHFQLILITHDVEFVRMIGGRAHCDYYYEVSKDANQHSVIRKLSMK